MDLPPLIMLGNKKQGVGFKNNVGSFWTHDALRSSLMVPTETKHPCFFSFLTLG
jgi:hypothetical protein